MTLLAPDLIERTRACCIKATAEHLGARLKRDFGAEWIGPCLVCGGRDRFSVNTKKQTWNCRGCKRGGRDPLSLLAHVEGLDLKKGEEFRKGVGFILDERIEPAPATAKKGDGNLGKARWLWSRSQPAAETLVGRYLRVHRGYHGPIPPTIRFLPAYKDLPPAMIAPYALTVKDVRAVHLTRLDPDGARIGKKITIGQGSAGFPIVLAPPNNLGLAITEGIEDGLSIHEATGMGAWAAGCDTRLPHLAETISPHVEHVFVSGDNDPDGRRDATELARRLRRRGVSVILKFLGSQS